MVMIMISLAGGIGNIIRYLWGSRPEKLRQNEEYDERIRQALERYQPIETSETIPPATQPFPKHWLRILCWYGAAIIVLFVLMALIPNPYAHKKRLERAGDYTALIALEPDNAQWYLSRGVRQGNTERAMADFDKAIELDPNYAEAYNQRAQARLFSSNQPISNDDYLLALDDANTAIRLDPNVSRYYYQRAQVYGELSNFEAAEKDLREMIRLKPNALSYSNRGNFFEHIKKDLQAALADYMMAIELSEQEAAKMRGYSEFPLEILYRDRGDVYKKLGELEKATADFEKAK